MTARNPAESGFAACTDKQGRVALRMASGATVRIIGGGVFFA